MTGSLLETILLQQQHEAGLEPVREYRFHPPRRWRMDFAYPALKIGVEVEGGIWSRGRHVRGSGFSKDCEKRNQAQLDGWILLSFTPDMIYNGSAIKTILQAIKSRRQNRLK